MAMLTGCGASNNLWVTEDQGTPPQKIELGLTPAEVIKLYLTLSGYGQYVIAYELLTNEAKRETTISDIESYAKVGTMELEKILSIQEKGDLSLISAVVKYTNDNTNEIRYEIQDFVLKKQGEEWRIIQENLLSSVQLDKLHTLLNQKAMEMKNNKDVQKFMAWMKEENTKLAQKTKEEVKEQIGKAKEELTDTVKSHGGNIKQGIQDSVYELKSGLQLN